jgi:hypothetical protein
MDKLSGTRYMYTKTKVAWLVPFIFLIPSLFIGEFIVLLNSRAFISNDGSLTLSPAVKIGALVLGAVGLYVGRDLWRTFLRTVTEEIWITDHDIVWIGKNRRVLRKASYDDILRLLPEPGKRDRAWFYKLETLEGPITFTRSIEHSDELIARIDAYLERSRNKVTGQVVVK